MATTYRTYSQTFFNALDRKLEPPVKAHLKNVYSTLALAACAAGAGGYLHLFSNMGGTLAILGSIGCALLLYTTPDNGKNTNTRLSYLLGFAGCTGMLMGPLLEVALYMNPVFIPTAFVFTFLVFASFTLCSIFSNHAKWIFMGGSLLSMLNILLFTSLINLFIGSYFIFQAQLYLGIALLCAFIMYDTAVIIQKRRMGDTDYISHSMVLFIDAVDLFQKLLTVLLAKDRRERNRRSS